MTNLVSLKLKIRSRFSVSCKSRRQINSAGNYEGVNKSKHNIDGEIKSEMFFRTKIIVTGNVAVERANFPIVIDHVAAEGLASRHRPSDIQRQERNQNQRAEIQNGRLKNSLHI